jgi:transposase
MEVVDRVAGLDVHKDTVMAAVRVPDGKGGRSQTVREFRTFTGELVRLRDWLVEAEVGLVVMEATGVYWKPPWHVLEGAAGLELMLVNAHHVKNLPGRKTDVSDAAWLAQLAECGLLRGSFVPPPVIARLRDLTRYRKKLIEDRAKETQRVQKVLEDAGIKLDSVVTDVLGKASGRMLDALIAGERDPEVLADMALTRMRPRIPELRQALVGRFDQHHALMIGMHLTHVDHLGASIDGLDAEVDRVIAPFADQVRRLMTIPGVGKRTAEVVIAEMGVDMGRFPSAAHLASWAGLCPGQPRIGRQTAQRSGPQRQRRPAGRAVRGGVGRGPQERQLPGRPVPPVPAPLRPQSRGQGHLRLRPHPGGHDLAHPRRGRRRVRRPGRRLVRAAHRPRRPHPPPGARAPEARPPSHPRTRSLSPHRLASNVGATPRPASARSSGCCSKTISYQTGVRGHRRTAMD